jgi:hypothetical protein
MSKFWNSLFSFFGTKIKASSSFHPETDGQTEAMNKTLEIMIRHYVNFRLDDWDTNLPILEFAYNNTPQVSTNYSPFYLLYGRHPKDPLSLTLPNSSNNLSVDDWIDNLRAARGSALDSITFSQTKQAEYANRHRESLVFVEGDLVLLSTKNIHVHVPSDKGKKLKPRFVGPFKVLQKLSDVTYKLELPAGLSKLHPVFHAVICYENMSTQIQIYKNPYLVLLLFLWMNLRSNIMKLNKFWTIGFTDVRSNIWLNGLVIHYMTLLGNQHETLRRMCLIWWNNTRR